MSRIPAPFVSVDGRGYRVDAERRATARSWSPTPPSAAATNASELRHFFCRRSPHQRRSRRDVDACDGRGQGKRHGDAAALAQHLHEPLRDPRRRGCRAPRRTARERPPRRLSSTRRAGTPTAEQTQPGTGASYAFVLGAILQHPRTPGAAGLCREPTATASGVIMSSCDGHEPRDARSLVDGAAVRGAGGQHAEADCEPRLPSFVAVLIFDRSQARLLRRRCDRAPSR